MRQAKKVFTRILLNNWGGISHKILELNEYVNLFSGKSGSGKSTVMDAIQVILYGSLASNFLNKAADDAKNRRSILSYLRGEQKDGTANRGGRDFSSQLVMEIKDTGTGTFTCVGVTFDVGMQDQDIRNYYFFSHTGELPEDGYLADKRAYSIAQMRELIKERGAAQQNRRRGDINRLYPSNSSYTNTLYEVILGYIDGTRFQTMEKSAIALKMTDGTGEFIRNYMFPKSRGSAIEKISEQLGAYRDISEKIEDLEQRITLLTEVRETHLKLVQTKSDIIRAERSLTYMEIEALKIKLAVQQEELMALSERFVRLNEEKAALTEAQKIKSRELIEVEAELKSSDYGKKLEELKEIETTLILHEGNSREWNRIVAGLDRWETDEVITDYVSNPMLQLIDEFRGGKITEADCLKLRQHMEASGKEIEEQLRNLDQSKREIAAEIKEKSEIIEDLTNNRKPYKKELKKARTALEQELSNRFGRRVPVYILADLFNIRDEEWKDAVEGRLGRIKLHLITAPQYAVEAATAFRKMKGYEEVQLINSAAIIKDEPKAEPGSLYETVEAEEEFVSACLKRYLGRVMKCYTISDLERVRDGVTPDCYAYSNYIYRHLRRQDYTLNACIGTKVSKSMLAQLEEEVASLRKELNSLVMEYGALEKYRGFEMLHQMPEQLVSLSSSEGEIKKYLRKKDKLQKEIEELETGDRIARLEEQKAALDQELEALHQKIDSWTEDIVNTNGLKGKKESEIKSSQEKMEFLMTGYVANQQLEEQVREALKGQSEASYRVMKNNELERLKSAAEHCEEARFQARSRFNEAYRLLNLSGMEKDNEAYDRLLDQYRTDYEPQYKEEFREKYNQVYTSLRDNVIATIHGELKAAYRHRREINRMLAGIQFSDSIYQIDLLPAENENGQFYDMLMAEELDSKEPDYYGIEGQLSLGDDAFLRKYEQKIKLLTEKFMPVRDGDNQQIALKRQEMEKYADYRNYLTFSMYERVIDENGNEKKNLVDDMAGRDSGGEGQNPKYVALLAGFAMLYIQQTNRDSRIKLVLLDEAFSKMDKERSEVCLQYARELDLQLIVCVPDERLQSLIRYVDCVYGFRRHQNQISMMHIDKGRYLQRLEGDDAGESEGISDGQND